DLAPEALGRKPHARPGRELHRFLHGELDVEADVRHRDEIDPGHAAHEIAAEEDLRARLEPGDPGERRREAVLATEEPLLDGEGRHQAERRDRLNNEEADPEVLPLELQPAAGAAGNLAHAPLRIATSTAGRGRNGAISWAAARTAQPEASSAD